MKVFTKDIIKNFATGMELNYILDVTQRVTNVIESATNDIRKKCPHINENFEVFSCSSFYYEEAAFSADYLDMMLGISSSQIELNTSNLINHKLKAFKERFKEAWANRKKRKKKDKYLKKHNSELDNVPDTAEYNIIHFQKDLVNAICNYITPNSVVEYKNGVVYIKGEDFPFTIRIFTTILKDFTYNYYVINKNKFINIDFSFRYDSIEGMHMILGERPLELMRIFASLYYNIYETRPNSIFIESLIWNLPPEILKNESDVYDVFKLALNYFNNISPNDIKSIIDDGDSILKNPVCGATYSGYKKFINDIIKYTK